MQSAGTHSLPDSLFHAIAHLIQQVESKEADRSDLLLVLAEVIKMVTASEADSYLLLGVLAQGAVNAIEARIPLEQRRQIANATAKTLLDRVRALVQNGVGA